MPRLQRVGDGAGDSGLMCMIWPAEQQLDGTYKRKRDENGELVPAHQGRPELNCAVQVGSIYARSYQSQDYWMTTPITEILEDNGGYMRFKTTNSEYEWWDD